MSESTLGSDRGLIDLASERLGTTVLGANDEFFAEKENLIKRSEAIFIADKYTERGKWMDGWETRRRREPGYDWCILRFGVPGRIKEAVVDTAFFRGNFPESCSIEGTFAHPHTPLDSLINSTWTTLLEKSLLKGDSKNSFAIKSAEKMSHIRVNIFPDGGVARLRLFGDVVPDWQTISQRSMSVDLAAVENGGYALSCSDMFFSDRNNLLMPGFSTHMGDGWETKRRRGPGYDWVIIRLGHRGVLQKLEVDTSHFKGNAPDHCFVDAIDNSGANESALTADNASWKTLLNQSKLLPNTRHQFTNELLLSEPVTHLRLRIYPDGGVARFRAWGLV